MPTFPLTTFANGLVNQYDLLQIENVLYAPKSEELVAREVFAPNTSYSPTAREVGYDYYQRTGSAKILARGAKGSDVTSVGETGGRITNLVFDIAAGIDYTRSELIAMEDKRSMGKGPAVSLDTLRVDTARRFINETHNQICFPGDAKHGIKGVFDDSFYGPNLGRKEDVADGSASSGDKKLWANKTPQEIIEDLNTGVNWIEGQKGIFKARVLIIPPSAMQRLRKPYSDMNPMTTFNWIMNEGMYFEQVIVSRVMSAAFNGDGNYDWFMILDNDPEVVQHVITEDIFLGPQEIDKLGNVSMAAMMSTAGVIVRHPGGFYIGKHIG